MSCKLYIENHIGHCRFHSEMMSFRNARLEQPCLIIVMCVKLISGPHYNPHISYLFCVTCDELAGVCYITEMFVCL